MKALKIPIKIIPFVAFFAIAAVLGFINHFRSIPLFADYSTSTGRSALLPAGIKPATIDDVRNAISGKSAVIVDVRLKSFYDDAHIPSAVSVPEDQPSPDSLLRLGAPEVGFESRLIVYCDGGDCEASINTAIKLQTLGFKNISVFLGGWGEWSKQELKK
jgi:rhodanese-related sulfurtransferase